VGGMGRGQLRESQRRAIRSQAEHQQAGRCSARLDSARLDRRVSAHHQPEQPEQSLAAALAIAPESIARRRHCRDCRGGREATRGGREPDAPATPLAALRPALSLQGRKRQREFGGEGQESVGVPPHAATRRASRAGGGRSPPMLPPLPPCNPCNASNAAPPAPLQSLQYPQGRSPPASLSARVSNVLE
jgi:hypothetical protein